ncbi:MAG TPA: class I SAM-dependent methyltransferase [Thermopetrobacter sp.]|nr:class I SAM-dependent methyltransferase [Thermopetrobacter sp.]
MSPGASGPGVAGSPESPRWVREMFGRVARRYDLLNHLLSFQMDRYWRWRTVRRLRPFLARPGAVAVDLCCGSGDLTLALSRAGPARVFGCDFSRPMLAEARRKAAATPVADRLFEADALRLPLPSRSADLLTVAFGFRNLASYHEGLREMLRVLKPGGVAAILEFSRPPNPLFRRLYEFYSTRILPAVGNWISGHPEAYSYLPESVRRFPDAPTLAEEMRAAGFVDVEYFYMTGGIVSLHTGAAPPAPLTSAG